MLPCLTDEALDDMRETDFRVLYALCRERDYSTNRVSLGRDRIATLAHVSDSRYVSRSLDKLRRHGIITTIRESRAGRTNRAVWRIHMMPHDPTADDGPLFTEPNPGATTGFDNSQNPGATTPIIAQTTNVDKAENPGAETGFNVTIAIDQNPGAAPLNPRRNNGVLTPKTPALRRDVSEQSDLIPDHPTDVPDDLAESRGAEILTATLGCHPMNLSPRTIAGVDALIVDHGEDRVKDALKTAVEKVKSTQPKRVIPYAESILANQALQRCNQTDAADFDARMRAAAGITEVSHA
jgi:hypothetical protein